MKTFLKADLADEDNPVTSTIQAESLEALLEAEVREFEQDDRLSPVYGLQTAECLSHDENSVQWAPGDGGQYTIAVYAEDTPEGREEINSWVG